MDSACFSLLHVLKLYYAKPPIEYLAIMTGTPLEINKKTLVSLLGLKFCKSGAAFGLLLFLYSQTKLHLPFSEIVPSI